MLKPSMPNFASLLKSEILRLARKGARAEIESLRKASSRYRSEIAELKRRIEQLERQLGWMETTMIYIETREEEMREAINLVG